MKSSKGRRIIRDLAVCLTQCFANVWPEAWLSPQTVSNGAVCFAKCKHNTLNALILSNLLAFQRRGVLIENQPNFTV